MSLKRFVVVPVVLVLVAACGETALEPATPEAAVAFARGGPLASGSGHFIDTGINQAGLRNFAFTAHGDGKGQVQVNNRRFDFRIHGSVECVSVDGNKAWVAYTVTQSSNPNLIGQTRAFRVVDNGQGKNDPLDQITRSFGLPFEDVLTGQDWCDGKFIDARLPLFDIEVGGNITVRP